MTPEGRAILRAANDHLCASCGHRRGHHSRVACKAGSGPEDACRCRGFHPLPTDGAGQDLVGAVAAAEGAAEELWPGDSTGDQIARARDDVYDRVERVGPLAAVLESLRVEVGTVVTLPAADVGFDWVGQ